MIRISLLIATYNRAEALIEALQSVVQQTLPPAEWECVVVDNRSTDDTAARFAAFAAAHPEKQLRLVREERQGLSHARNCGIAASRGALIAIIDDDERINVKRSLKMDGNYQSHTGNEDWFIRIEKEIEKEPEDSADEPENSNRPDAKSVVEEMLRNYGNYDPEKAEKLLTGKRWELWFWMEYDSSWSDIYKHFFFYGETYYTGFSIEHYTLHANGTLLHEYESLGEYVEKEGKWSFDPETRILQLPGKAVCIEALSHNRILWQEERIYLPSETHYDRRIYKAAE